MQVYVLTKTLGLLASTDGDLSELQHLMISMAQKFVTFTDYDINDLERIDSNELIQAFDDVDNALANQLVYGLIITSLVNEHPNEAQLKFIQDVESGLGADKNSVKAFKELVHKQKLLYSFDVLRQMYIGEKLTDAWKNEKFKGVYKMLGAFAGIHRDESLAARFRAFDKLPDGSLGKTFIEFYRHNQFPLPGEKNGAPEPITYHDMAHILGGYDITPHGELNVAAFSAGFRKSDGFWVLLFIISQFHLGITLAPLTKGLTGNLQPEKFMLHLQRGTLMNKDLITGWDYWPVIERPIDELREEYNIVPLEDVLTLIKEQRG